MPSEDRVAQLDAFAEVRLSRPGSGAAIMQEFLSSSVRAITPVCGLVPPNGTQTPGQRKKWAKSSVQPC